MVTQHECHPLMLPGLLPPIIDETGRPLAAASFEKQSNEGEASPGIGAKPMSLVVVKGGSEIIIDMCRYAIHNVSLRSLI